MKNLCMRCIFICLLCCVSMPVLAQSKPKSEQFVKLSFRLDTGAVTFKLPHSMVRTQNNDVSESNSSVWCSAGATHNPPDIPKGEPFVNIVRGRIADATLWSQFPNDPASLQKWTVKGMLESGRGIKSEMLEMTPKTNKQAIEESYKLLGDPRKIFGKNSILYAKETVVGKSDGSVNGYISPGGTVQLSDKSGAFMGTAYIVDVPRRTIYTIQVSFPGELNSNKAIASVIQIVMLAELSK